ncbi:MAG: carbohydrate kinase family protein [Chthonomonas sp.]|nr:carbohydrate kinase family protein [Chthonomonas sp.]
MREILIAGTVCWDRLIRVPEFPRPGQYIDALEVREGPGGEAYNTAFGLLQLGMSALVYGNPIGSGLAADRLRQGVEKVGLRRVVLPGGRNRVPQCDILVTPDGQRTMLGDGFTELAELTANLHVSPLRGGIISGDMNLGESIWRIYDLGRAAGMMIYAMDSPPRALGPTSYYQTSTDWVGKPGIESDNCAAAHQMATITEGTVILTDGNRGFYVGNPRGAVRLPAFPISGVVDTTGAGDAFRAGMLFSLAHSWPLGQSLAFASLVGGLACRDLGATGSCATRAEVEQQVAQHRPIYDEILRLTALLN